MRMMLRLFVAFCVATILAQGIILAMAGARGNLKKDTFTKAMALLNGIDIQGDRLQNILESYQQEPVPTYQDVTDRRAAASRELEMREKRIELMQKDITEKLETLRTTENAFNERLDEFYKRLDDEKNNLLEEGLQQVKRTLESIAPDQAKTQLLKLYEDGQKEDVIAIIKALPTDKRKKIIGEFAGADEEEKLSEILKMILQGEPTMGLLDNASQLNQ